MAKWPNLKIIGVLDPPEVLYNHICVSCHECLQQSQFWFPGCDLCLPTVCDHLSWATIFAWPTGWSLNTSFIVLPFRRQSPRTSPFVPVPAREPVAVLFHPSIRKARGAASASSASRHWRVTGGGLPGGPHSGEVCWGPAGPPTLSRRG